MNRFDATEMEMLTEGGWSGDFIENVADGDEIAMKTWGHNDEPPIKFVTVAELVRIPRFERDDFGRLLSEYPNYLMQFIGVHESGLREPMSYGSGWAVFRKAAS